MPALTPVLALLLLAAPDGEGVGPRIQRMVVEAQEAQLSMNQGMRRTVDILREARQGSDIVRMSCVNEKLTVIKGIIRISEDAFRGLTQASERNDIDQAGYEHNKIVISRDRVNSLTVQAVNCVGSSATATGDTKTKVEEANVLRNTNVLATQGAWGDPRDWSNNEQDQGSVEGEGGGDDGDSESGEAGTDVTGGGVAETPGGGTVSVPGGTEIKPPASARN